MIRDMTHSDIPTIAQLHLSFFPMYQKLGFTSENLAKELRSYVDENNVLARVHSIDE